MDAKFLTALTYGHFGNGRHACQALLYGQFWTRRLGCHFVYRGSGHVDNIDFGSILASCTDTGLLTLPANITHQVDTNYFYAVRRVSRTGKPEQGTTAVVRLSLDSQGQCRPARANMVRDLRVQTIADGKMKLTWWYWPLGQAAEPTHFAVYGDGGTGTINYDSALVEVEYTGVHSYTAVVPTVGGEETHRFGVRGITACGVNDRNSAFVTGAPDLAGPNEIEGIDGVISL